MPVVSEKGQAIETLRGARVAFAGRLASMTRRRAQALVRSAEPWRK